MLIAGGNWNNGTNCGSRSRNSNNVRSNVNTNIGGRGVIRGVSGKLIVILQKQICIESYTSAERISLA